MSALWFIKAMLEKSKIALVFAIIFAFLCVIKEQILIYLYPCVISILFLGIFASSLKDEAIITKIAKKQANLKGEVLPEQAIDYTRSLTKLWCAFFVFNTFIAGNLAFMEEKFYWTLYTGVISYVLMGVLFVGEFIYRKAVIEKYNKPKL